VSLPRLAAPVFVIGALLSAGSLWLNLNVVPNAKATIRQLLYEQASRDPGSLLKPGVVQGGLSDQSIKALIEAKDGDWVKGFHLFQIKEGEDGGKTLNYVHATRAALSVISEKNQLRAKLENAYFETRKPDGSVEIGYAGKAEPLLIDLRDPRIKRARASAMTNAEILAYVVNNPQLHEGKKVEFRAEITKRYSFSMACLAFAFIAVPLGLKTRRRDTSGGLVASLLLGVGYFLFTVLVDQFETDGAATAILWTPNILCVLIGLYLFRRARFK
jgi:lipopolysaccharide export LptBFGC system permease protein LptF